MYARILNAAKSLEKGATKLRLNSSGQREPPRYSSYKDRFDKDQQFRRSMEKLGRNRYFTQDIFNLLSVEDGRTTRCKFIDLPKGCETIVYQWHLGAPERNKIPKELSLIHI